MLLLLLLSFPPPPPPPPPPHPPSSVIGCCCCLLSIPCCPTYDPPHRQWLIRVGAGGTLFVIIVIVPPSLGVCHSLSPPPHCSSSVIICHHLSLFVICHCSLFPLLFVVPLPPVVHCPLSFIVPPLFIAHNCSHPLVRCLFPALPCHPTHEPPHEQLLVGVGVGAVLSVVGGCCSRSLLSSHIRISHYQ
jgi:hypothetical protein